MGELGPWWGVGRDMYALTAETFRLSEAPKLRVGILVPRYADTDIAVEFDCLSTGEDPIPEAIRQTAAEQLMSYLDTHQLTREGSAEVWIRQGRATVFPFPRPYLR